MQVSTDEGPRQRAAQDLGACSDAEAERLNLADLQRSRLREVRDYRAGSTLADAAHGSFTPVSSTFVLLPSAA